MKVCQNGDESVGVSSDLAAVIVPGHFRVSGPVTERSEKARLTGRWPPIVSKTIGSWQSCQEGSGKPLRTRSGCVKFGGDYAILTGGKFDKKDNLSG